MPRRLDASLDARLDASLDASLDARLDASLAARLDATAKNCYLYFIGNREWSPL
jgi:hypothetical protein